MPQLKMMPAMMTGPPERSFLSGHAAAKGHQELHHATELVAAVREVAMVATCDEKHPQRVKPNAERDVAPGGVKPQHAEGGEMQQEEGDREREIDFLLRIVSVEARGDGDVARGDGAAHDSDLAQRSLALSHELVISG